MFTLLKLRNGVGSGLLNDEEDVAATDRALRDIGVYVPPQEYAAEPQRFPTAPMLQALERVQGQTGIKVDGLAFPGGPTERTVNNRLVDKPRGAASTGGGKSDSSSPASIASAPSMRTDASG